MVGLRLQPAELRLYMLVRAMLNHMATRGHGTRGRLALSLARGARWAALYSAPVAVAIWLFHVAI